jgi:hypothetical protein
MIRKGWGNESSGFGEEDLPQLQDHPAQRRRARHLHGPAAQAAARVVDRKKVQTYFFSAMQISAKS